MIYHQFLYGSSIKETVNVFFTSTCTAFVSKIRRLYRQRGEVNRKRKKGRQRILSCKLVFVLFMFGFLNNILNNITSINFSLTGIGTDKKNKVLEAIIRSKPELYIDEYQDWFHAVAGTQGYSRPKNNWTIIKGRRH